MDQLLKKSKCAAIARVPRRGEYAIASSGDGAVDTWRITTDGPDADHFPLPIAPASIRAMADT
jgi:hypothetical protein